MFLNKMNFIIAGFLAVFVMVSCDAGKGKGAETTKKDTKSSMGDKTKDAKGMKKKKKKIDVKVSAGKEASRYNKQKVVYHFNVKNFKKTNGGLRNIKNHYNATQKDGLDTLDAIAVFHGGGVLTLLKNPKNEADKKWSKKIQGWISSLKIRGLKIDICANTLKGKGIDYKKELLPELADASVVPSGVAELSYLEKQGYTYIRP